MISKPDSGYGHAILISGLIVLKVLIYHNMNVLAAISVNLLTGV